MTDWIIGGSIFALTVIIIIRLIHRSRYNDGGCGFCKCENSHKTKEGGCQKSD